MSSDSTRERLLRAAAEEVAKHGYRGASLRGVAARAEIRAASIFHYFPEGKEQLVRAMLTDVMQTIATRMTPTLDDAADRAQAERMVRCAALLWDFLAEHPAYAGALMREAFEPDEAVAEVIQQQAEHVVKLSVAYIQAGQASGGLAAFDARRFLLRMASFVITFHAAPTMRRIILGSRCSIREERRAFLQMVRDELTGA